ncbi:MAG TPA: endonuclease/exonuclease/phosphatase family protein [Burkholderiaceae bacterium]|nr:endonuclease/exonuclease/phosphatase family protein [Burkholderiaceae bacterium]
MAASLGVLTLAACPAVPDEDRMLLPRTDGGVMALTQPCGEHRQIKPIMVRASSEWLDTERLRVLSWNMHKFVDAGWDIDLARYALDSDLVLLQEAVMTDEFRRLLDQAGHDWIMAGAFARNGVERGVLSAARVRALDGCTLRTFEPLFPVPKSALVVRYRLGANATVAVANLHGINFTLGLERFREQLEAVAAELARHRGPVILAGDFNTWSEERHDVLVEIAARLGLVSVLIEPDGRRRTLGRHLDHFYFRGFRLVRASAPRVTSSDHNPILVELELR